MKTVVTLVHGTFANTESEWIQESGALCTALRGALDGVVVARRFEWTGRNRNADRRHAAADLARTLDEGLGAHPDARHFIIAHSHGGNVALGALRDPVRQRSMSGLVCLGTPFVRVSERNTGEAAAPSLAGLFVRAYVALLGTTLVLSAIAALGAFLLAWFGDGLRRYADITVGTRLLEVGARLQSSDGTGVLVAASVLSLPVAFGLVWSWSWNRRRARLDLATQEEWLRMAEATRIDAVPMLVVRAKGDEALLGLRLTDWPRHASEGLARLYEKWKGALWPGLLLGACSQGLTESEQAAWWQVALMLPLLLLGAARAFAAVSGWALGGPLVALQHAGFGLRGSEGMSVRAEVGARPFLADRSLVTEHVIREPAQRGLRGSRFGGVLRHALPHSDDASIEVVITWIKDQLTRPSLARPIIDWDRWYSDAETEVPAALPDPMPAFPLCVPENEALTFKMRLRVDDQGTVVDVGDIEVEGRYREMQSLVADEVSAWARELKMKPALIHGLPVRSIAWFRVNAEPKG